MKLIVATFSAVYYYFYFFFGPEHRGFGGSVAT